MDGIVWLLRERRFFAGFLLFFISIPNLCGQVFDGEIKFVAPYQEITPFFPDIHVGAQYIQEDRHVDGHPFYNNQLLGMGKITISGFDYSETPLQYDIVNDLVITISPIKNQKAILDPDKIETFTLGDSSTFIKVNQDIRSFYHGNGFYREIVQGNVSLYCKHYKEIVKDSSPMTPYNKFFENQKYYIELENEFHPVRKKKDAFKLLQVTKREIRPELKRNNLKFKRNKEAYLKVVVNNALKTRNNVE
ncbi:MAG TPA: hypothetical protein VK957_06560 [Lunatimonas sp.]|nr:hypothetical protein [Lunatimonas sp.]